MAQMRREQCTWVRLWQNVGFRSGGSRKKSLAFFPPTQVGKFPACLAASSAGVISLTRHIC